MSTKTLLRTMALLAAAGGAVALVLPFLEKSGQEPPGKRRRSPRRPAGAGATLAKPAAAEKSPRGTRTRRSGNGGPPSHH